MSENKREFHKAGFLDSSGSNFDALLRKVQNYYSVLENVNTRNRAKFPGARPFDYEAELENTEFSFEPQSQTQINNQFADLFAGAMKCTSPFSLLNLRMAPLLDTVAVNTVTNLYSVNNLVDLYSGKMLLYENKIARSLGKLVGWNGSYGIACSSGKVTMLYAVRSAIARIDKESGKNGIREDMVFLVNAGAHYSLEHVLAYLGVGSTKIIRIACDDEWRMRMDALEEGYDGAVRQGRKVAGIILAGGTTINFAHDDVAGVVRLTEEMQRKHRLDYAPYIHLDSVIGWLWFCFLHRRRIPVANSLVERKIHRFLQSLECLARIDSFGVDFHKTGLCPCTSSFFVARDVSNLNLLTDGQSELPARNLVFGQLRSYRYTLENSRSSTGVTSAWVATARLGVKGYQEYLVYLLEIGEMYKAELRNQPVFEVLNDNSLGWEVVFKIHFPDFDDNWNAHLERSEQEQRQYDNLAKQFIRYVWDKVLNDTHIPLFGIIPEYQRRPSDKKGTAFLLYPSYLALTPKKAAEVVQLIGRTREAFLGQLEEGGAIVDQSGFQKPIR